MSINLEDLTIGQLKQILSLFVEGKSAYKVDPLINKYVIVRTYRSGVHAGTLISQEDEMILLADSRRLWSWKAKQGVALSGVAKFGLDSGCKIDSINPLIRLTSAIEVIVASDLAQKSINEY